jgi:hypothetical protein
VVVAILILVFATLLARVVNLGGFVLTLALAFGLGS